MIKISGNSLSRDPIPSFLIGLSLESLADLSWTDPQLGVQDCAWWPEEDQSPALQQFERYGEETLTLDPERRVVVVVREVVPWSAEEIAAERKSRVPQVVSMRQARLALLGAGLLANVEAALAAMPGAEGQAARVEWEYATEVRRDSPRVAELSAALGLTESVLDDLFLTAATL